jgi:hypothetical protein
VQRKRIAATYHLRPQNSQCKKTRECLWGHEELSEMLRKFLIENYDYYAFCNECIGSPNDLFGSRESTAHQSKAY